MPTKIEKFLRKLEKEKRNNIVVALARIKIKDLSGFDVKKLKGYENLYRVRLGDVRIIFSEELIINDIVAVSFRGERTYNF